MLDSGHLPFHLLLTLPLPVPIRRPTFANGRMEPLEPSSLTLKILARLIRRWLGNRYLQTDVYRTTAQADSRHRNLLTTRPGPDS